MPSLSPPWPFPVAATLGFVLGLVAAVVVHPFWWFPVWMAVAVFASREE